MCPAGWCKFPLKLTEEQKSKFESWHTSYHGTTIESVTSIVRDRTLRVPDNSEVFIRSGHSPNQFFVYTSPCLEYAAFGLYASPFSLPSSPLPANFRGVSSQGVDPTLLKLGEEVAAAPLSKGTVWQVSVQLLQKPNSFEVHCDTAGLRGKYLREDIPGREIEWRSSTRDSTIVTAVLLRQVRNPYMLKFPFPIITTSAERSFMRDFMEHGTYFRLYGKYLWFQPFSRHPPCRFPFHDDVSLAPPPRANLTGRDATRSLDRPNYERQLQPLCTNLETGHVTEEDCKEEKNQGFPQHVATRVARTTSIRGKLSKIYFPCEPSERVLSSFTSRTAQIEARKNWAVLWAPSEGLVEGVVRPYQCGQLDPLSQLPEPYSLATEPANVRNNRSKLLKYPTEFLSINQPSAALLPHCTSPTKRALLTIASPEGLSGHGVSPRQLVLQSPLASLRVSSTPSISLRCSQQQQTSKFSDPVVGQFNPPPRRRVVSSLLDVSLAKSSGYTPVLPPASSTANLNASMTVKSSPTPPPLSFADLSPTQKRGGETSKTSASHQSDPFIMHQATPRFFCKHDDAVSQQRAVFPSRPHSPVRRSTLIHPAGVSAVSAKRRHSFCSPRASTSIFQREAEHQVSSRCLSIQSAQIPAIQCCEPPSMISSSSSSSASSSRTAFSVPIQPSANSRVSLPTDIRRAHPMQTIPILTDSASNISVKRVTPLAYGKKNSPEKKPTNSHTVRSTPPHISSMKSNQPLSSFISKLTSNLMPSKTTASTSGSASHVTGTLTTNIKTIVAGPSTRKSPSFLSRLSPNRRKNVIIENRK